MCTAATNRSRVEAILVRRRSRAAIRDLFRRIDAVSLGDPCIDAPAERTHALEANAHELLRDGGGAGFIGTIAVDDHVLPDPIAEAAGAKAFVERMAVDPDRSGDAAAPLAR